MEFYVTNKTIGQLDREEMSSIISRLNDEINNHLFNCQVCKPAITLNVARVQLLMQEIVNDYEYLGYITPDNKRLFERANSILRKRIARTHAS